MTLHELFAVLQRTDCGPAEFDAVRSHVIALPATAYVAVVGDEAFQRWIAAHRERLRLYYGPHGLQIPTQLDLFA